MVTLSRRRQSEDSDAVRPQQSRVFAHVQRALLEASEMG